MTLHPKKITAMGNMPNYNMVSRIKMSIYELRRNLLLIEDNIQQ